MAEITGIFAASHAPGLIRDWDTIEVGRQRRVSTAFEELGRRIHAARPDVIIAIGADHWANFFLDNMPAICLGVGEDHEGPPEQWLANYPHTRMAGQPDLGVHLAHAAFAAGFEPSLSYHMCLDHAFCVPMWKAALSPLPPIIPVVINALQMPMPTVARCLAFGELMSVSIKSYSRPDRIVILATGGLSHSVGEPRMGQIDETFDRECIDRFSNGDAAALIRFLTDERIERAGNGAAEVRFWAAAHGAANMRGFELIHYEAVPETYTGCGFAEWKSDSPNDSRGVE